MNRLQTDKKYSGQALAIVMLVLVVSALIGLSIYSRTRRDKALTLEERASAEALEVSDIVLNSLTGYSVEDIIEGLRQAEGLEPEDELNLIEGVVLLEDENNEEITTFFGAMGLSELLGVNSVSDLMGPLCPIGESTNEYRLTFAEAQQDITYPVPPGFSWSFSTRKMDMSAVGPGECKLTIYPTPSGDVGAGFVISRIYCEYDDEDRVVGCQRYREEDMESHCFSSGSGCNNSNFLDEPNWLPYNYTGTDIGVEEAIEAGSKPSEIRLQAVSGTVDVSYELSTGCPSGYKMYQLRVTANCMGVYRGKEIVIPEDKWYSPIFDYVIFNSKGNL